MATAVAERKTSRLDLRLADGQKRQIEAAASNCGVSVSQWALDRLLYCASQDNARARQIELSAESFEAFVRLLEGPQDPTYSEFLSGSTRWE